MSEGFILHGTIVYSRNPEHLKECPDSYVICRDGYSEGVFSEIPKEYRHYPVEDYWDKLIIPGLSDLSLLAPAYQIRGMDLDRSKKAQRAAHLEKCEKSFEDTVYSERAYDMLVDNLYIGSTTRAVLLGDRHTKSVLRLMDLMDESGMISCVGESVHDLSGDHAELKTYAQGLTDWINSCADKRYDRTSPILTLPSDPDGSDEALDLLGQIAGQTGLPTALPALYGKSCGILHTLSEKGLAGAESSSVITCGVFGEEERNLIRKNGMYLSFCPETELSCLKESKDISPIRTYLEEGLKIGLGSGSGGYGTSMMKVMKEAILASEIRQRFVSPGEAALTLEEAFYLATVGGGSFFGECGSFDPGYQFDAVVLDDQITDTMEELTPAERLERMVYLSDDRNVVAKYVFGDKLY